MSSHDTPDNSRDWRQRIGDYIARHPDRPQKTRALARELAVPDEDYATFRHTVHEMLDRGELLLGRGRTLALPNTNGTIVGTFRANRRGFGFVQIAGRPDVYVARENTANALDGDIVSFRPLRARAGDTLGRAEVVRIIERAAQRLVGVLERAGKRWFVRPQGKNAPPPVLIEDPTAKSARAGDLVVIEPIEPGRHSDELRGVILERLGEPDDLTTQIRGIIRRYDIPDEFPVDVRRQASETAAAFDVDEIGDRVDLRDLLTITIDPVDARDFDDAISIEPLPDGGMRLGVHIADVSHFVPPGSALDREAYQRGNSVYFPRFVVPMLPESLSNGVCSLQPGQSRFTMSAFIDYDRNANVTQTQFESSVIRSSARLAYEQASAILEGRGDAEFSVEVVRLLRDAERLAKRIRQRRLKSGMIVLALPEVEIVFDDAGRVADARPADTSFSHTIIEMFMVEANEAVSRFLALRGIPHLRRVHPAPDEDDVDGLRMLGPVLGRTLSGVLDRRGILAMLGEVAGRPEERITHTLLLRSMAQARYSPAAEGHFALASEDYCHFTSPIRRYPDLVVHRLLDRELRAASLAAARRRGREEDTKERFAGVSEEQLSRMGDHTSKTERRAQQAEREVRHMLLLELMEKKIGQVVDVVITGIAKFGVFVQVQRYLADGVIRVNDFGGDHWDYDDRSMTWRGRGTRHVIAVGQKLSAIVAAVDRISQELSVIPAGRKLMGTPMSFRAVLGGRSKRKEPAGGRGRGKGRAGEKSRKSRRGRE